MVADGCACVFWLWGQIGDRVVAWGIPGGGRTGGSTSSGSPLGEVEGGLSGSSGGLGGSGSGGGSGGGGASSGGFAVLCDDGFGAVRAGWFPGRVTAVVDRPGRSHGNGAPQLLGRGFSVGARPTSLRLAAATPLSGTAKE